MAASREPRTKKQPAYKSFRLAKKIKPAHPKPLPGIYQLWKQTFSLLLKNKKLFFGIIGIYIILNLIFVNGPAIFANFFETKHAVDEGLSQEIGSFSTSLILLEVLIGSYNIDANETGSVYQLFLSLFVSLALIWAIRQTSIGEKISIKQAFYKGLYPLVQFMLVVGVIILQLIPFFIGNYLLVTALANSIAITAAEKSLFVVLFLLLSLLSLYMMLSSIFALYIVTLPDMTPLKALRSARQLVLHRRFSVAIRLLGIPILSILFFFVLLFPLFYLPFLAVVAFIIFSGLILYFFHAYNYSLYRSLL